MKSNNPTWPGENLVAVTPSDSDTSHVYRQLYVGVGGDIRVTTTSGTDVNFIGVSAGTTIGPFFITKVKATGTTASSIVGFI